MEQDIWFVDDDPIFSYIVQREMESGDFGRRIRMFDDGDTALLGIVRASENGTMPALVFLDLNMKRLDGWQMVDMLNEFEKDVKVVILTSSLNPKDQERAKSEPLVREIIFKPVTAEQVILQIGKYTS